MFMVIGAAVACGDDSPSTPAGGTVPAAGVQPGSETTPVGTPPPSPTTAAIAPTAVPAQATRPEGVAGAPLTLDLLSPRDGAGVEIGAVRVLGKTQMDAIVGINQVPVELAADGSFVRDLILDDGANLIEAAATDISGRTAFQEAVVFLVSPVAGLPFSLFYPPDGLQVTEPTVSVIGGSRPDAVVGVNGVPVDMNALGIFSSTVSLDEGANLIEVVASDIQGNVRFQTAVVFYTP
ncbi:MAG: hypothetical protein O3A47_10560 [Chloroflexi bacterium]|nr:hypothetical protein [Chloroflexota bacterium]